MKRRSKKCGSRHRWQTANLLIKLLALALAAITTSAQSAAPPPASAETALTKPDSTVEQLAATLAPKLPAKRFQIVVADFTGPDKHTTPLDSALADEFSAALAKNAAKFTVVDRQKLKDLTASLQATASDKTKPLSSSDVAERLGDAVVTGTYGDFNGSVGLTIDAWHVHGKPDKFEFLSINGKVAFTPALAALLGQPVESLRPVGGVFPAGSAGLTNVYCLKCDRASYPQQALQVKLQGIVTLNAEIAPEGTTTRITVLKGIGMGLDESAIAAVKTWTFAPAINPDGNPVASTQIIEVQFHLGF